MVQFDVIVVGAGAAGCVLANRLTEDDRRRVLLVEAGPDYGANRADWPAELRDPGDVPGESHPWGYEEAGRSADRPKPLPRARVVGGSTTINACTWLRGSASDYDAWSAAGNADWGFAELLPFFRLAESDPAGGVLHGATGPVPVFRPADSQLSPVDQSFLAAAIAAGFPYMPDLNGSREQSPGIGPRPQNVEGNVRMNAAFTYLAPARDRTNLDIDADVLVDRVVLDGGRAVGIRTAAGEIHHANSIILAAGAYGTPAILLRSGVGPADHLRAVGVDVAVDLPGVGRHLLDHPLVLDGLPSYRITEGSAPHDSTRQFLPLLLVARRVGGETAIDVGVMLGQAFDSDSSSWVAFPLVCLLDARSEGQLRLTGADPGSSPDIRHRHLDEQADVDAMADGVELATELLRSPAMTNVIAEIPGRREAPEGRAELTDWLRQSTGTMFHPAGTCRMAPDGAPDGVVDSSGRVLGVEGVYVVDASIFPALPRATIHFPVVAVAEKLAATIAESI